MLPMQILMHESSFTWQDNLTDLQDHSLRPILLYVGMFGLIYFMWALYPPTGGPEPMGGLLSGGLLLAVGLSGHYIKQYSLRRASIVVVLGIELAIAITLFSTAVSAIAYLFIIPIILAGVLGGRRATIGAAIPALLSILIIGSRRFALSVYSIDIVLPALVIALSTATAWLSARTMFTVIEWMSKQYELAQINEKIARDRQAEVIRIIKSLDEATYRIERANDMLKQARDLAEEAHRLKQQFAQNISHELRTPLNLIVGFTELMVESPDYYGAPLSPAYLRDLNIVHRNAIHLQSLVNDVLDLARIEAAQMNIIMEKIDPAELIVDAVSTARSMVEVRGLKLLTEIEPELPRVQMDPTRIRQVLFNLINNATRFTEQGAITISVRAGANNLIFTVRDTGIGIAANDLPRLFQEFHQLDNSIRRKHGGTGLGLTICKRFVELHGGKIWAESEIGVGTSFIFTIPAGRDAQTLDYLITNGKAALSNVLVSRYADRVLLVITRSPSAGALLSRYVKDCHTLVAPNMDTARDMAKAVLPQVVVLDVAGNMLDQTIDTVDVSKIAQDWQLPLTTFIITPLPGEEPERRLMAVDAYLTKPVSRQNLLDTLRQFGENVDRILVIDDDRDFVRLLGRMLEGSIRRYQLMAAYSATEGLDMVKHYRPDLLILDLDLPQIDGYTLSRQIRGEWPSIPIIVISGYDRVSDFEALNGSIIIAKMGGFTPGNVVQLVQKALDILPGVPLSATTDHGV